MIFPSPLHHGDKFALISPATVVDPAYIEGAAELLRREGFTPVVMPHAKGPASGSFAASEQHRLSDLTEALHDTSIKAILCARGGYGCVHLLRNIPPSEISANPKWLIGFSDVSALHALWQLAGVASIHGPMAKHLTLEGSEDICARMLLKILTSSPGIDYNEAPHPLNRKGCASGRLIGGNLAVLNGLSGTPFDLLATKCPEGVILFIEDVSEAIYAVERMLMRLTLSDVLPNIKGLIVGKFTEYKPDRNHPDMETMISSLLSRMGISGIPVAFSFPTGHVKYNLPLVEGDYVSLRVSPSGVTLKSIGRTY